jgi:hypothetical protein
VTKWGYHWVTPRQGHWYEFEEVSNWLGESAELRKFLPPIDCTDCNEHVDRTIGTDNGPCFGPCYDGCCDDCCFNPACCHVTAGHGFFWPKNTNMAESKSISIPYVFTNVTL